MIRGALARFVSVNTLAGVALLSRFPTFAARQTCSWFAVSVRPLNYSLGYKPCSRIARGRDLKAETWESDRIMLSKLSEGHRLPLGGKAGDDVFLHKKANNFTLFLFIRHVRLGIETWGEA